MWPTFILGPMYACVSSRRGVLSTHSPTKVKVGQIQAKIAAAEAERKRIFEAFERQISQRCTVLSTFRSILRRPWLTIRPPILVNAIASIAEGMPTHLENTLSKLERKCKDQDKETPDLEKSVAALLRLQMN